ncbi:MAG: YbhB/YbcL family Raf kinase inhibitor-like protein, partial [Candidatus Bathyarchaeia archaeon]
MTPLKITSSAFKSNGPIPKKYTCDGIDVNPPLSIEGLPKQTVSLVLIVDDPDAPRGTWVHWVIFNIPGEVRELREGIPAQKELPDCRKQGLNEGRKTGDGGAAPP